MEKFGINDIMDIKSKASGTGKVNTYKAARLPPEKQREIAEKSSRE